MNRQYEKEGLDEVKRWFPVRGRPEVEADIFLNPPTLRWTSDHTKLDSTAQLQCWDEMREMSRIGIDPIVRPSAITGPLPELSIPGGRTLEQYVQDMTMETRKLDAIHREIVAWQRWLRGEPYLGKFGQKSATDLIQWIKRVLEGDYNADLSE